MTDSQPRKEMSLFEHLAELRLRLAYALLGVAVGSVVAYCFSGPFFDLLTAPYFNSFSSPTSSAPGMADLIGTGPAEAFLLKIKVSLFIGVLLASPVVFFQIWLFIAPGLYEGERKWLVPFLLASTLLFVGGAVFCYQAVFPVAFRFFNEEYASIGIKPVIKISEYLSLVIQLMLAFGLVFELPVLTMFLARFGVVDHHMLTRWFRPAVLVIFILSAILTPPDIISQFLLAVPMLILYGVSILVAKYAYHPRQTAAPAG